MDVHKIWVESRLEPFLFYLERAAQAQRRGKASHRKIWLEAAEVLYPLDPKNLSNIVREAVNLGRGPDAVRIAEALRDLEPDSPDATFRLGSALQLSGRNAEALPVLRRTLDLDADYPFAHNNIAAALMGLEAPATDIVPLLETAARLNPDSHEAWTNLATERLRLFDLEGALAAGEKGVALAPDTPISWNNWAQALKEAKRFDEALACFEKALALAPDEAIYRLNLGLLSLLTGRFAAGWEGYEARWWINAKKRAERPVFKAPAWAGEPLQGKTLLVWGEEGNGDVIQFCRFIPQVAALVHAQGGRIVWNSYPQFEDLMSRSLGSHVDQYVTGGLEVLPPYDFEFGLLSSARLLNIDATSIPTAPYLLAEPRRAAQWRARLSAAPDLKVGLVWSGSSEQGRNPFRSLTLEAYVRAFSGIDGVRFYSLQFGGGADVAKARDAGFPIEDLTPDIQSYEDTAAIMTSLDLVVSICTSTAHLAGALGCPLWVPLDVNPHWVWRLERTDSDWYPTARLFRQQSFGRWDEPLEALRQALLEKLGAAEPAVGGPACVADTSV